MAIENPVLPVVVRPWMHDGRAIDGGPFVEDVHELMLGVRHLHDPDKKINIYGSSLGSHADNNTGLISTPMVASSNGLLHSVTHAYSRHHHLVLRPEDFWFQILVQFSVYVNKHAEELRSRFVAHEGKKKLRMEYSGDHTRWTFDYGLFARDISQALHASVTDPELRDWVLPAFSTTTNHDLETASVIMMATLQHYFEYEIGITCGIPTVTLLGQRKDYENILQRLDKLDNGYGPEPARFATLLRPVIRGLIETFDEPGSARVIEFWRGICDISHGSGFTKYTGWITAFAFWSDKGECVHRYTAADDDLSKDGETILGGVKYHAAFKLPMGVSKVPVTIDDERVPKFEAEMVVGSVGVAFSSSGKPIERKTSRGGKTEAVPHESALDTMQPVTGWWIQDIQAPSE